MPTPMRNTGGHSSGVREPGDFTFYWEEGKPKEIIFKNPACRMDKCHIRIRNGPPEAPHTWGWDGNMDKPTITPSIGCDRICGWHGHIINGEITP